jgi:DNA-binding GntR family transcriptional regulator
VSQQEQIQKIQKSCNNLKYYEIKKHFIDALNSGALIAHSKLPSERELTKHFDINRNTVRHVLKKLEWEGYIYRSVRRGWFVRGPRLVYNPARHLNFVRLVAQQGMEPSWKVLETQTNNANKVLAAIFNIAEGDPLYLESEIGAIDGLPAYYAETFLNARLCPDILPRLTEESITDVLENEYHLLVKQTELLIRPKCEEMYHRRRSDIEKGGSRSLSISPLNYWRDSLPRPRKQVI